MIPKGFRTHQTRLVRWNGRPPNFPYIHADRAAVSSSGCLHYLYIKRRKIKKGVGGEKEGRKTPLAVTAIGQLVLAPLLEQQKQQQSLHLSSALLERQKKHNHNFLSNASSAGVRAHHAAKNGPNPSTAPPRFDTGRRPRSTDTFRSPKSKFLRSVGASSVPPPSLLAGLLSRRAKSRQLG